MLGYTFTESLLKNSYNCNRLQQINCPNSVKLLPLQWSFMPACCSKFYKVQNCERFNHNRALLTDMYKIIR